jgi:hypothetical protein
MRSGSRDIIYRLIYGDFCDAVGHEQPAVAAHPQLHQIMGQSLAADGNTRERGYRRGVSQHGQECWSARDVGGGAAAHASCRIGSNSLTLRERDAALREAEG